MWHILLWLSGAHHISFLLNRYSVIYRFPFPILGCFFFFFFFGLVLFCFVLFFVCFCFFTAKSPQRSVSQENTYKKSKNRSSFFKQFQGFKQAKFEFKVTVHYSLWVKCTQLWPLKEPWKQYDKMIMPRAFKLYLTFKRKLCLCISWQYPTSSPLCCR